MSKPNIIEESRVFLAFKCSCGDVDSYVTVHPKRLAQCGTPVCEKCDQDMKYMHTEVEPEMPAAPFRYLVAWKIELSGRGPRRAAMEALRVQRDPGSIATVFEVTDRTGKSVMVDLEK